MKTITFYVATLIIGNKPFLLSDISHIKGEKKPVSKPISQDDGNQHFTKSMVENIEDKYLSIYFREGDSKPRTDDVFNRKKKAEESNPKTKDQIEMPNQRFVLISPKTQRIFLSNYKKKARIEEWLLRKIGKSIVIKGVIDNERFLDDIKFINSLQFSGETPLLSQNSGLDALYEELTKDIFGYELPIGHVDMKFKFKENHLWGSAKKNIAKFLETKKNTYSKIVVSGRTDKDLDRIFNTKEVVDKIKVNIKPDDNGLFNAKEVFSKLIKGIKRYEE